MTSNFPPSGCLWLRARGFYKVGPRVTGRTRDRGGCRHIEEVRRRISATLIDRYHFPSPLAWKNTGSSMSSEINKRKPPDRSSPPIWFSRGLTVTFPQDKVVTKVTPLPKPLRLSPRHTEGGVLVEFSPPTTSAGSQRRSSEALRTIDEHATVSLTFSQMHQGSKDGTSCPRSCGACSMQR